MDAWRTGGGRRSPALALGGLLLVAALALSGMLPAPAGAQSRKPRLAAFGSCDALVSYARRNARRTQGLTGVPTRAVTPTPQVLAAPGVVPQEGAAVGAPTASGRAPSADSPAFSGTNIQEAGVDEPDIVKTDGRRVVAIANGMLHVLDVTGAAPRVVGTLRLDGSGHQLLVRGDRALVIAAAGGGVGIRPDVVAPGPRAGAASIVPTSSTLLAEVDLADPAAPAVRRTLTLDGTVVDGRLTGGTARLVVGSSPEPVPLPAIRRAGLRTWVPRTVLRSRVSGKTFRRSVVACDDVRRPRAFSGLDLLTVLTIDLDRGLFAVDRDAIMAGAQTVYASPRSLYVASQRFVPALEAGRSVPEGMRTEIHRFDASGDNTTYRSSGQVTGFVLNQYALSEHEGFLRVASTDQPQFFPDGSRTEGQSFVTVLQERGAVLAPVGRAGGLGRGERIYAVRFVGDRGYVVTFRQVDPLYTLDLSRPSEPRVLGELKILGYSAYLHPVSDDLLLGVGQDATAEGRLQGTQLSLFDVSDLRRPRRAARADLGLGSSSDAEFDPHAFLFWKPSDLAVIPLSVFGAPDSPGFTGAVGFRVGGAALTEAGRVTHPGAGADRAAPPIGRSLVIGDRLYTLSYAGLGASRLDTLQAVAFAPFASP